MLLVLVLFLVSVDPVLSLSLLLVVLCGPPRIASHVFPFLESHHELCIVAKFRSVSSRLLVSI